ncbi:MAG: glycoside hydrolase family 15 protein, partial [Anaerolineales bacterium]
WPQNMWMDGTPYWGGVQMDETAFPILLADLARRNDVLTEEDQADLWPMIQKASSFLVRNGPVTQQDRWEEDPGYSPFTLAVEIAALLAAAEMADIQEKPEAAKILREIADAWNANIECWTYVKNSKLAHEIGVEGYYVRIAPPEEANSSSPLEGFVPIKNRPPGESDSPASMIVSPDALALVRFGLRSADDPRILNTVKVIDALLKTELPAGPTWRRYNQDGYGEHQNGLPFDGDGIGRVWPLLTGERAHYELAAGNKSRAKELLITLQSLSNANGLLPEQSWDGQDIPDRDLFFGEPTGSAMPLVWAHAEYLKLCRSLADGRVFDMPPQPLKRYAKPLESALTIWAANHKIRSMAQGTTLRLLLTAPAKIRWSKDAWDSESVLETQASPLAVYFADLPTPQINPGQSIEFKIDWEAGEGDGTVYQVDISE